MVPSVEKLNKLTTQELREMKSAYESDRHERKELIDFIHQQQSSEEEVKQFRKSGETPGRISPTARIPRRLSLTQNKQIRETVQNIDRLQKLMSTKKDTQKLQSKIGRRFYEDVYTSQNQTLDTFFSTLKTNKEKCVYLTTEETDVDMTLCYPHSGNQCELKLCFNSKEFVKLYEQGHKNPFRILLEKSTMTTHSKIPIQRQLLDELPVEFYDIIKTRSNLLVTQDKNFTSSPFFTTVVTLVGRIAHQLPGSSWVMNIWKGGKRLAEKITPEFIRKQVKRIGGVWGLYTFLLKNQLLVTIMNVTSYVLRLIVCIAINGFPVRNVMEAIKTGLAGYGAVTPMISTILSIVEFGLSIYLGGGVIENTMNLGQSVLGGWWNFAVDQVYGMTKQVILKLLGDRMGKALTDSASSVMLLMPNDFSDAFNKFTFTVFGDSLGNRSDGIMEEATIRAINLEMAGVLGENTGSNNAYTRRTYVYAAMIFARIILPSLMPYIKSVVDTGAAGYTGFFGQLMYGTCNAIYKIMEFKDDQPDIWIVMTAVVTVWMTWSTQSQMFLNVLRELWAWIKMLFGCGFQKLLSVMGVADYRPKYCCFDFDEVLTALNQAQVTVNNMKNNLSARVGAGAGTVAGGVTGYGLGTAVGATVAAGVAAGVGLTGATLAAPVVVGITGVTAAAGAIGGALAGWGTGASMFCDDRLKVKLGLIGEYEGIRVYLYRYKSRSLRVRQQIFFGVSAQELRKHKKYKKCVSYRYHDDKGRAFLAVNVQLLPEKIQNIMTNCKSTQDIYCRTFLMY